MKQKLLSLILALIFLFSAVHPFHVSAYDNDKPSDSTITRVYEEILSGNITSEEDVLRVALAQDNARTASATNNSRSATQPVDIDDSAPMISQVLETTTDENGDTIYLIADTGLLVVDENGEAVNRHYLRTTETFEDLDITARHTVYYYLKLDDIFSYAEVKLHQMSTMILYEGTIRAVKLEHYYHISKNAILVETHTNLSSSGTFIDTFSGADWVSCSSDYALAGFGTSARIYDDDTAYEEISIDVTPAYALDPDGNW